MEFDLAAQPQIVQQAAEYALVVWDLAKSWVLSPAAWSQFALLVVSYLLAVLVARRLRGFLTRVITPAEDADTLFAQGRRTVLLGLPLLLPLLAYLFTAIGESVVRSLYDSGAVIAFGKRVFLFLAVRTLVREIISDPFLKLLGRYVLIPVAAIYAVGLLDPLTARLNEMTVTLGNISFSVMSLVRGIIAGGVLFWLGGWSNRQTAQFIENQKDMRPSLRQLTAKVIR